MDIEKTIAFLKKNKQPKFRWEQIKKAIFQEGIDDYEKISNLPKNLRQWLKKRKTILSFEVIKILVAVDKLSVKAVLKLTDGNLIETVLISPKPGFWSVCISCQVGCAMQCAFCATGKMGWKRNLTAEEIIDQVLFWKQYLKKMVDKNKAIKKNRISNVVYMGMGEPFLNWSAVKESLIMLTSKEYFNLGSRSISVSTVGITGGIKKIMTEFPQINLAISLHFSNNEKRSQFMPANKQFNLQQLKKELEEYFTQSQRKVFLEYILFKDINDNLKTAEQLVKFIKSFSKPQLLHVNIIIYNETLNDFQATSQQKMQQFKKYLERKNIKVTIRKNLGTEIQGACGQLATKDKTKLP